MRVCGLVLSRPPLRSQPSPSGSSQGGKASIKVASRSDEAAYNGGVVLEGFVESHFTYSTLSRVSNSSSPVRNLNPSPTATVYPSASAYDRFSFFRLSWSLLLIASLTSSSSNSTRYFPAAE